MVLIWISHPRFITCSLLSPRVLTHQWLWPTHIVRTALVYWISTSFWRFPISQVFQSTINLFWTLCQRRKWRIMIAVHLQWTWHWWDYGYVYIYIYIRIYDNNLSCGCSFNILIFPIDSMQLQFYFTLPLLVTQMKYCTFLCLNVMCNSLIS